MEEAPEPIRSYQAFLEAAIRRYWDAPDMRRDVFLALLLATPEAWQVAWEESTKDGLGKPALAGAASVATVAALLRTFASGRLGLLLTGLSVGTLIALYGSEQAGIRQKAAAIRELVKRTEAEFHELAAERDARPMREAQWELIVDGLVGHFLAELREAPAHRDPASIGGFAEHVAVPSLPPARGR